MKSSDVKTELLRLAALYKEDLRYAKETGSSSESYHRASGKLFALRELETFILNKELEEIR